MSITRNIVFTLLLILVLAPVDMDAQCAMCRAVLESDATGQVPIVSRGINDGILYLMGFPYLLMLGVAVFIFRDQIKGFIKK